MLCGVSPVQAVGTPATRNLLTTNRGPQQNHSTAPHERGTSSCFSMFLAAGALLGTRPDQGASEGGPFMTACDLDAQSRDPSRGCAGASHWLPDGAATTHQSSYNKHACSQLAHLSSNWQ